MGRDRAILVFLLVTFGWSWGVDGLVTLLGWWDIAFITVPRTWGPLVGAIAAVWWRGDAVGQWLRGAIRIRGRYRLALVAVAIPLAVDITGSGIAVLAGASAESIDVPWYGLVLNTLAVMLLAGGLEEFGWRGYLQRRLQREWSPLTASVVIGIVWTGWHLPLFLAGLPNYPLEPAHLVVYAITVVGTAVVLGALANAAAGSVIPAMVLHAVVNQPTLFPTTGGPLASGPSSLLVVGGLWWLVVAVLVGRYGRSLHPGDPLTDRCGPSPAGRRE